MTFEIPVALFIFKRLDTTLKIIDRLRELKSRRVYLIGDGGRNPEEVDRIRSVRCAVEAALDWGCEILRYYQQENVGIHANLTGGVRYVFEREPTAIFLEDDNLPELSFFEFCRVMLTKYEDEQRVLWICGSNYLDGSQFRSNQSYYFTRHMLPCGWASWRNKFEKYYDGELSLWGDRELQRKIRTRYVYRPLYQQDLYNWLYERDAKKRFGRFYSWDYQMSFSMRAHDVFAIVPRFNQIKNIGVDELSTHGGSSTADIMVQRFCNRPTKSLTFPLNAPPQVAVDNAFEIAMGQMVLRPEFYSIKSRAGRLIRKILRINRTRSFHDVVAALNWGRR